MRFLEPFDDFSPSDFVFKIARSPKELDDFWKLRHQVFCLEQKIFQGTDRDEYDESMIPIICTSLVMGMEDQVVGVVRIEERERGVWWGSRLGVHPRFRNIGRLSSSVPQRNSQPPFFGKHSIGAGLIYKAVSTANGLGCHTFLALVQSQNARFFERLHWTSIRELEYRGHPHFKMQADLPHYPPALEQPVDYYPVHREQRA